jgi:hypothetical protein
MGSGRGGHLQAVNLTLREKRGVDPLAAIFQPIPGIETGVGIVVHAIQIGAWKSTATSVGWFFVIGITVKWR